MRRRVVLSYALVLGGIHPGAALAQPSTRGPEEIAQLLDFVRGSGCEFFRNGTWYEAPAAHEHLRSKYLLAMGNSRITVAEDFIDRIATRSSFSGQAYAVRCAGNAAVPSAGWLRAELNRLRLERGTPASGAHALRPE